MYDSHAYTLSYRSVLWFAGIVCTKNKGNFPLCLISQENHGRKTSTQTLCFLFLVFFMQMFQTDIPTKFML